MPSGNKHKQQKKQFPVNKETIRNETFKHLDNAIQILKDYLLENNKELLVDILKSISDIQTQGIPLRIGLDKVLDIAPELRNYATLENNIDTIGRLITGYEAIEINNHLVYIKQADLVQEINEYFVNCIGELENS